MIDRSRVVVQNGIIQDAVRVRDVSDPERPTPVGGLIPCAYGRWGWRTALLISPTAYGHEATREEALVALLRAVFG